MTGLLNAAQLAALRAAALATLDTPGVTITRPPLGSIAAGAYGQPITTSPVTVATGIACRLATPTGHLAEFAERIGAARAWKVTLPYGTAIQRGDVITLPSGDKLTVDADVTLSSYSTATVALASELA